ncbi:MAG: prolyl oligopeptidase family serine peptidase [Chitinophagales bacterium]|nr:prolyl oligopeptidase family serine peptidase [Chitinophagales bacterium]
MKKLFFLFIVVIFLSSCKKSTEENNSVVEAKTILNVAYASNNSLQNMDVYLPANRNTITTYPILLVHGGSWSGGDKTDFDGDIASIKDSLRNYAIFNINYRLANGTSILLQQQIDDINAAINFIESKSNDYLINTNKWGILGASAGAHLALLKTYKYNTNNKIKAVADLFGPTDMTWMYNNHPYPSLSQPIIQNVLGTTPSVSPTIYYNASPINFASTAVTPTIIFHGTADEVVPISESVNLKNALITAGISFEYYSYNGESHGWTGANLTDTHNKLIQFFKNHLR